MQGEGHVSCMFKTLSLIFLNLLLKYVSRSQGYEL